jgi:hypothetical protein
MILTVEQQRAVDGAGEAPPRAAEAHTGGVTVLIRSDDFDWIRQLLGDEPDAPRAADPRTGVAYALVPEGRYERFKAFFEEDPLTPAERSALLRESGRRAGWDAPDWNDRPGEAS